jgi:hypothetical protein
MSKKILIAIIFLVIMATSLLLRSLNEPPLEFVTEPSLADAVARTNLDRFPGEGKLMMAVNHSPIRSTVDMIQAARYNDGSGLAYLNAPSYYGEEDLLQIAQEQGVDVYQLVNDPAFRRALIQDPETYKRLKQLGW